MIWVRYCLESVSICKVDVDEEFTNVFKKNTKMLTSAFFVFWLIFAKKSRIFTKN